MKKKLLSKEIMLNCNIEKILEQIKPIISFHARKTAQKLSFFSKIKTELYEDIFQELQIAAWVAIKKFESDKSKNPYYYINIALKNATIGLLRKNIRDNEKETFAIYNYIIIEGEKNHISDNIIHTIEAKNIIDKLPQKIGHIYKKAINHELLSNKDRVMFKAFINKNSFYRNRFKDYFIDATF
jgi:DNA-directed RNA polymerase specialized sigma24 family protein